jgi:hypothetical protein
MAILQTARPGVDGFQHPTVDVQVHHVCFYPDTRIPPPRHRCSAYWSYHHATQMVTHPEFYSQVIFPDRRGPRVRYCECLWSNNLACWLRRIALFIATRRFHHADGDTVGWRSSLPLHRAVSDETLNSTKPTTP